MKKMEEMLLQENAFSEIVMGNTAIVRAMIESGVRVVTSYPGSPTPEIASALGAVKKEDRPFYFEFSTNEKVATEVAFGASVNGLPSCVFFKSVGLNVATDSFVQLGLLNLIGGMVIVLGDDPGANSSQNEQDNRHYAKMTYIPVVEPATPQEVYEMFKEAIKVSKEKQMPVILRLTTHVCHAKQKVNFKNWQRPAPEQFKPQFSVKNGPYIPITSKVFPMKERALNNLSKMAEYAEDSTLNTIIDNKSDKGIITAGLPFLSLTDVLEDASEKPDILKLGIIHPLPRKKIADFLKSHQEVKILEELDDILEKEIKTIAYEEQVSTKIIGKTDLDDWMGEYTPDKVINVLNKVWPNLINVKDDNFPEVNVPLRPAQLCPGCGHRSAFYAIKKAIPAGTITVGDIGCHTLGFLPPYNIGEVLLCMGHSTGTAAGLTLFNDERKVVAFLGDSTFFHAGIPGIVNALFNKHNLTLIVMENGTTAMTGHQNHPATGANFDEISEAIPIRKVLEGLGVKKILESDTYNQKKLIECVKESLATDEFSVVIAKHPCILKKTREDRRNGTYKDNKVLVQQEICDKQYECVSSFGCPSYQITEKGVQVNNDLCIGDGSCIQTCPTKALKITTNSKQDKE